MKSNGQLLLILLAAASWAAPCARAQTPEQEKEVGETYNPYLAEKDLEVGMYYLKTGNYDAAIERLQSCLVHRPNYARPRWYLAQAHTKKGELAKAIQYYTEFAAILKTGKEADKARKEAAKLTRRLEEKKSKRAS